MVNGATSKPLNTRVILKQVVVFPKVYLLLRLAQDFAEETSSQLAAPSY